MSLSLSEDVTAATSEAPTAAALSNTERSFLTGDASASSPKKYIKPKRRAVSL
ncbi:hypothetical protein L3081_03050 [Colwellia sp. MSW7]|uniref:Uncharacterized protein n=1 Tax=Colwellia maritima TaxID=2912588 RepID=A0ABS9WX57_9GAMM|nr:hypothetical protein [Colwellia maritima]MCI2282560.1 hypothetical protein [Colwellia maritima]